MFSHTIMAVKICNVQIKKKQNILRNWITPITSEAVKSYRKILHLDLYLFAVFWRLVKWKYCISWLRFRVNSSQCDVRAPCQNLSLCSVMWFEYGASSGGSGTLHSRDGTAAVGRKQQVRLQHRIVDILTHWGWGKIGCCCADDILKCIFLN